MNSSVVVKANGIPIDDLFQKERETLINYNIEDMVDYIKKNYKKRDIKKLKYLVPWLWGISAGFSSKRVFAAQDTNTTSLWSEMQPIFGIFQDIAMVVGAIAIIAGLIIMMFKKTEGRKFVMTSVMVLGGCFIVPAAITLIAILAGTINDTLINVFRDSNLKDSIQVGG